MVDYRRNLEKVYNNIWKESRNVILKNSIDTDGYLAHIANDKRRGLTLLIPLREIFQKIISDFQELEPNQYYYPASDVHITIMDFIRASDEFVYNKNLTRVYMQLLNKVLADIPKFILQFKGITASNNAIMVKGFCDATLSTLRYNLRKEINKQGIELQERYEIETAHSTIIRFKNKLANPVVVVKKIESMKNLDIAKFEVTKLQFVLHDWYNIKEKTIILKEYTLQ